MNLKPITPYFVKKELEALKQAELEQQNAESNDEGEVVDNGLD